ncbi:MAG TPA: hypothetical protein VLM89_13055 [Phycisphaerae bacterium]|nr:hypothetical protein [Phycisphaerae bacterium]
MSDYSAIESEIVDVLAGLVVGDGPLLATVTARSARDRRELADEIQREAMPAAYVVLAGRQAGDVDSLEAGAVRVSVLLAERSLRGGAEVRVGGPGVRGAWTVSQQVAQSLQGSLLDDTWRPALVDERPAGGDEGTVVWEQRYEARRVGGTAMPTFDGAAIAGTTGVLSIEIGELKRASQTFAFPGVDGVFERLIGMRERVILWRGQLRTANDESMNVIEAAIEDEVRSGRVATMVDPHGRPFDQCVVKGLRHRGSRRRDELTGEVVQDVEIEFAQLAA